jgi:glycosyltransferase involved in cell wall biosynthesis
LTVPSVVTIHDLIPYRLEAYRKSIKEQRYFAHIQRAMPFADRLVAISHATYNDIAEFFPAWADKTVVIPNGVHPDFFAEMSLDQISQVARRYGLRRHPRVLYVGGYDERKNIKTLIGAMKNVFQSRQDGELVLVGAKDNLLVRRQVVESGIEARVVVTPFVSRADLVALYNSADVFVYPSLFEGFGMPPAQALAVGLPIVASDIPPIREVVGEYGVVVDPLSTDDWTDAVGRVMDSPASFQRQVSEGQVYAEEFSWPRLAAQYAIAYSDAVKGRRF